MAPAARLEEDNATSVVVGTTAGAHTSVLGSAGRAVGDEALAPGESLAVLQAGSKTFAFAGRFLEADRLEDAALLYTYCRRVDDLADEAPDPVSAAVDLRDLRAELAGAPPPRPWLAQVLALFGRRRIDVAIADELVVGVASDLGEVRVTDDAALVRYSYRVASTVGLMMCGVLGVRDDEAPPFAIDLGVGMQITNICRDVVEDAGRGRVYLPADRLRAAGVEPTPAAVAAGGPGVSRVVLDLLDLADRYYASADRGMRFIPWRARLAIHVASRIYRAIGVRLRKRGGEVTGGRVVVPTWEKLVWALAGIGSWMASPWRRGPHEAALHVALAGLPGADPAVVPGGGG